MRSFCLLTMKIIFIPNCSILHLNSILIGYIATTNKVGIPTATDYTPSLFVGFYNNHIYSYNSFPKNTLMKLFPSLECIKLSQFGIRTSSIEASKQRLHNTALCHVYSKTHRRKSTQSKSFLKSKGIQSCCFFLP